MALLAAVKLRDTGEVIYCDLNGNVIKRDDKVIILKDDFQEYAEVLIVREFDKDCEIGKIIRKSTLEDEQKIAENIIVEEKALKKCKEFVSELSLDMHLSTVRYSFNRKKMLFYYTADERVDFRKLLKLLTAEYSLRIELKQIGARDETKIVGGLGPCGRVACCKSFLSTFSPVSVKMAKNQRISLNPEKIAGLCGRLMCCIANEDEVYRELNTNLPKKGETVDVPGGGRGKVLGVNALSQHIRVLEEKPNGKTEIKTYSKKELDEM